MTHEEWCQEATRRFGKDPMGWKFVCPSCGHVASVQDWKEAGASNGEVAVSCVGRALGSKKELGDKTGGPCNYAGYGLFQLNPISVQFQDKTIKVFDFAEA